MRRSRFAAALWMCLIVAVAGRSARADDGTWTVLNPSPGLPSAPNQHVAVFAAAHNQVIAFGGSLGSDTWVLDLNAMSWSKLNLPSSPSARLAPSAIYDPVRDQMVVFGGYDGTYLNEVWTLSLSGTPAWTQVATSGTPPPGRDFACAVYDAARDRLILFAGFSGASYNDVWALDLATMTWSQLAPTGAAPGPRYAACAIFDPAGDQMVLFGGQADAWTLSLGDSPAWTQLHPAGQAPSNRQFATAVYDADAQRMVIHGGHFASTGFADTYELTLGSTPTWRLLSPGGPAAGARWAHAAIVDPTFHRMLLVGGSGSSDLRSLTWPPGQTPTTITSVAPLAGHVGDDVTIYGSSLAVATAVRFNGAAAPILSNTGTLITTAVPSGATTGPVWIETPTGNVAAPGLFTVLQTPEILSFTPTLGLEGAQVTITGRDLAGVTDVTFNTTPAPGFTIVSDNEIDATVPVGALTGPIKLRNVFGVTSSVGNFAVIHPAPLITSVTPSAGRVGTPVVLTGQYLAHVVRVAFYGDLATPFSIISDTEIHTAVPLVAQTGPITVANASGTVQTPVFQVIRTPPVITSASPASARRGETVSIFGQYFGTLLSVSFGGGGNAPFTIVSDNEITATLNAQATSGPIVMVNADGASASTFTFNVVLYPPIIQSATPSSGKVGQAVSILGSRFTGTNRVAFGPSSYATFTVMSDTELVAVVDNAAATGTIRVTNGDGTTPSNFVFTLLPPDGPPRIRAVRDVPNDQGGRVVLEWLASDFDLGYGFTITNYRVWRRAPLIATGPASASPLTSFPGGFWEPIGDVPAVRFAGYAFTASTVQDSVPDANVLTSFMVEALTADPSTYYFSNPDSGYSVDNLAPPYPTSLLASYSSSSARLRWSASSAPDLAAYRIYRGPVTPFPADAAHLVAVTTDTTFEDTEGGQAYELIAVDRHGGQSRMALVSPAEPHAQLIRLRSAITAPDLVRLTWEAEGQPNVAATLYRRSGGSDWARVADLRAGADGILDYEDRAVTAGQVYGYRLGVVDAGAELMLGETSATAAAPRLAIAAARPNPSIGGACNLDLDLLSEQPAHLELLDITGRRVFEQELQEPSPGPRTMSFAPRGVLPAGVYFLRIRQADRSGSLRLVVLD